MTLAIGSKTFEAARQIINCYHITFVKGHTAHRGEPALDSPR